MTTAWTLPNLRDGVNAKAKFIIELSSSWTSTGGSTYGIDTYWKSSAAGQNISPQSDAKKWVYQPAVSSAANRERRLGSPTSTGVTNDGTLGRIYHDGVTWTNPVNGQRYEIWTIPPQDGFNILKNITMRRFRAPQTQPLERFANANFQTDSATIGSWTVVGAGATLTPVTTAANVHLGSQSGFLNAANSTDYVKSVNIQVSPETSYFLSFCLRRDVSGPLYLAVWDETNNLEIANGDRVYHGLEKFTVLERNFYTPAGCKEVTVRIYCATATDDAYLAYANGPWKGSDERILLPDFVTGQADVRAIMGARYTYAEQGLTGAYDADSREFDEPLVKGRDWRVRYQPGDANPAVLELTRSAHLENQEIWVEYVRQASDIYTPLYTAAGESTTFNLPYNLFLDCYIADLCQYGVLVQDKNNQQALAALQRLEGVPDKQGVRHGGVIAKEMALYEADLQPAEPVELTHNLYKMDF
jgi:hypothetical protein